MPRRLRLLLLLLLLLRLLKLFVFSPLFPCFFVMTVPWKCYLELVSNVFYWIDAK